MSKLLLSPEDYELHTGRNFDEDFYIAPTFKKWLRVDLRRCAYCGVFGATTKDHIIPKAQGGTNSPENLIDCCHRCNIKKGNKTPEQAGMPILYDDRGF